MPRGRPLGPPTSGVPEIDGFLSGFRVVVLRDGLVTVEDLRRELGFGDKNRVTLDLGRRLISRQDVDRYLAASTAIAGAEPEANLVPEMYRLHEAACAAAGQLGVSVHKSQQSRLAQEQQRNLELRAELDQAERDKAALREELTIERSATVKSKQLVVQLKGLLQDVTEQLRESRRSATALTAELRESDRSVAALTEQNNALISRVHQLSTEIHALRTSITKLKAKRRPRRVANARRVRVRVGASSLLVGAFTIGLITVSSTNIQISTVLTSQIVATSLIFLTYVGTRSVDLYALLRGGGTTLAASLVLAKTVLIAGAVILLFPNPNYLLLAMAVAQIAPSSYAMLMVRTNVRFRHRVHVWAAIDGPISTLLVVYSAPLLAGKLGPAALAVDLLTNLAFAAVVFVVYRLVRRVGTSVNLVTWTVLLLCLAVATWQFLVLGIALVGLFLRPVPDVVNAHAERVMLVLVALLAGVTLADGVNIVAGVVLGGAAYFAQVLVALPIREPRFGLAHRCGPEVLVLALVLEPLFPGAVAILVPAVLVTVGLHLATNRIFDLLSPDSPSTAQPYPTRPPQPDAERRLAA